MTDQPGGSLNAAYEAIKAKDLSKARDVLSAYLIDHPNDVDAWWLYSYAVTDVEQARKALETVLRLDPAYPGARDLLNELENAAPGATGAPAATQEISGIRPLSSRGADVPLSTTVAPDDGEERAEFGFPDEKAAEPGGFSRMLIGVLAAIVIFLIVAAVLILPNMNRQQTVGDATDSVATDTGIPDTATDVPTEAATEEVTDAASTEDAPTEDAGSEPTSEATGDLATDEAPTDEPPTQEASPVPDASPEPTSETSTSEPMQPMYDALSDGFEYVPGSAGIETTDLGDTATVSICAPASQSELRSFVPSAMTALAQASTDMPTVTQAVAARFVNCTDNAQIRFVALNIADAQAYAAGSLSADDLRTRLIVLN